MHGERGLQLVGNPVLRLTTQRISALVALAIVLSASGASDPAHAAGGPSTGPQHYRVAAGTALAIELRTPLSSNSSRVAQVVEGRLIRALVIENVELVPAGATVLGTVTEVEPAGPKTAARLAFNFTVIQHPDTGSRAMIRAGVLAFRTDVPGRGEPLPEITLPKGMSTTVTLLQPLIVLIPR